MKLPSSPPELMEWFDQIAPGGPGVERRQMFGYPSVFVNGNLTAGRHADQFSLRLNDDDRAAFMELPGAQLFEPMPGRPMKQYVVVSPAVRADRPALSDWLDKSLGFVRTLPPKLKR